MEPIIIKHHGYLGPYKHKSHFNSIYSLIFFDFQICKHSKTSNLYQYELLTEVT